MVCVASGDIVGPVYEDFTYARLNRKDFRDVPGMVMVLGRRAWRGPRLSVTGPLRTEPS
jgi:hypothetical protein